YMIRIGIIGAGYMGALHASVLRRDKRVEVTAVHDAIQERGENLAQSIGAAAYAAAEELIAAVDAVYIATPNSQHTALALAAIGAGKNVFCEKPLATTPAEARSIAEAAAASSRVFQVGFNRRFAPVYKSLKEMLSATPAHSAHVKMNRGELLNPA